MEPFARLALLFLAAVLLVNYLHGGTGQVKTWLKAKFLNQA